MEASAATIVVRGDARQHAVHVLGEDGDIRVGCVIGVHVVRWRVARAQGDLLIRVRVDHVPDTRSTENVVSVLESGQAFVVVGVGKRARSAQTASQGFGVSHIVICRRQLTRAVVDAGRRVVVVGSRVGATFKGTLASQGEVDAVVGVGSHGAVSRAKLVAERDAHFVWPRVCGCLERVATWSQANEVRAKREAVTCECSSERPAVHERARSHVEQVVLCTRPSVAEAVKHVHVEDERSWVTVHTVTAINSGVGVVVGSSAVRATNARVVARAVVEVRTVKVAGTWVAATARAVCCTEDTFRAVTFEDNFASRGVAQHPRSFAWVVVRSQAHRHTCRCVSDTEQRVFAVREITT